MFFVSESNTFAADYYEGILEGILREFLRNSGNFWGILREFLGNFKGILEGIFTEFREF